VREARLVVAPAISETSTHEGIRERGSTRAGPGCPGPALGSGENGHLPLGAGDAGGAGGVAGAGVAAAGGATAAGADGGTGATDAFFCFLSFRGAGLAVALMAVSLKRGTGNSEHALVDTQIPFLPRSAAIRSA